LPAAAQITLNAVEEMEPILIVAVLLQEHLLVMYLLPAHQVITFTVTDTSGHSCTCTTTAIQQPINPDISRNTNNLLCNRDATAAFRVTNPATLE
jgi:hypothetical protein